MYPAPYPYPQPAAPPLTTPKGLMWSVRAFAIYLGVIGLSAALAALAFAILSGFQPGSDPGRIQGALGLIALGAIPAVVLALVVLIFYLIGFYNLYKGRNEYGPAHARNVRLGLFLLIGTIVAAVVGGVVLAVLIFTALVIDPTSGPRFDPSIHYAMTLVQIAFGIVEAAMIAGLLVLSVRVIARPDHQGLLYVAAGIQTAAPGVTGALSLLQLPRTIALAQGSTTGLSSVDPSLGVPTLVSSALGFVVVVIYLIVYRGAEARIRSGDLKPVLPPPAPPTAWMPGPVVPPAYPMPTQPWPPPSQPPQPPGPQGP